MIARSRCHLSCFTATNAPMTQHSRKPVNLAPPKHGISAVLLLEAARFCAVDRRCSRRSSLRINVATPHRSDRFRFFATCLRRGCARLCGAGRRSCVLGRLLLRFNAACLLTCAELYTTTCDNCLVLSFEWPWSGKNRLHLHLHVYTVISCLHDATSVRRVDLVVVSVASVIEASIDRVIAQSNSDRLPLVKSQRAGPYPDSASIVVSFAQSPTASAQIKRSRRSRLLRKQQQHIYRTTFFGIYLWLTAGLQPSTLRLAAAYSCCWVRLFDLLKPDTATSPSPSPQIPPRHRIDVTPHSFPRHFF